MWHGRNVTRALCNIQLFIGLGRSQISIRACEMIAITGTLRNKLHKACTRCNAVKCAAIIEKNRTRSYFQQRFMQLVSQYDSYSCTTYYTMQRFVHLVAREIAPCNRAFTLYLFIKTRSSTNQNSDLQNTFSWMSISRCYATGPEFKTVVNVKDKY